MSAINLKQKNKINDKELISFITKSTNKSINVSEKEILRNELIKGYKSTRKENNKTNKEFEETISDGLDDD